MVATALQNYGGQSLRIGDKFSVDSEADAADLVALRFAVREEKQKLAASASKTGRYMRRDLRALK
jgi:hypothetical protein